MTIKGHAESYEALLRIYKKEGRLDDYQIEWLLEHYGMASRALKRILADCYFAFDSEVPEEKPNP